MKIALKTRKWFQRSENGSITKWLQKPENDTEGQKWPQRSKLGSKGQNMALQYKNFWLHPYNLTTKPEIGFKDPNLGMNWRQRSIYGSWGHNLAPEAMTKLQRPKLGPRGWNWVSGASRYFPKGCVGELLSCKQLFPSSGKHQLRRDE